MLTDVAPKRDMFSAAGGSGSTAIFGRFGGDLFGDGSGVFEDGDGEAVGFAGGGVDGAGFFEEMLDLDGGGLELVGDDGVVGGGGEFFEEGGELELGEEVAAGGEVGRLRAHGIEGVLDGDLGVDGDEVFGEQNVVAIVGEGFAVGFALDGVGRGGSASIAASTVPNCWMSSTEPLSPMPGAPGMLSMESPRRAMTSMTRSGGTPRMASTPAGSRMRLSLVGIEDGDVFVDELHHVLVGRDDVDVVAERGELAGEGADDVVGLEAFVVEDGDAEGLEGAADVGLLLDEVRRRLGAVGLVAAVLDGLELLGLDVELLDVLHLRGHLVAMDGGAYVVDGGEVLGLEVLAQLVDHVDEDIRRRGGDAGARGHGARALHGVIGAEDEGHGVEEVDGGLCRFWSRWAWWGSLPWPFDGSALGRDELFQRISMQSP